MMMGAEPTHVDSHKHVHLDPRVYPIIVEELSGLGMPIRGNGRVDFIGGFCAQWEWARTALERSGSIEQVVWSLSQGLTKLGQTVTVFGAAGSEGPGDVVATLPGPYGHEEVPEEWRVAEWINIALRSSRRTNSTCSTPTDTTTGFHWRN